MSYDAFLEISGVEGESHAKGMEKKIEIYSFSWGASNPVTLAGKGLSGGKVHISSVNLMKKADKATPVLLSACATGKHYPEAKLHLRKATGDGGQAPFIVITLTSVMIESLQHSGSGGGDDTPTESLSLAFGAIKYEYSFQDDKGALTKGATFTWDLTKVATA